MISDVREWISELSATFTLCLEHNQYGRDFFLQSCPSIHTDYIPSERDFHQSMTPTTTTKGISGSASTM